MCSTIFKFNLNNKINLHVRSMSIQLQCCAQSNDRTINIFLLLLKKKERSASDAPIEKKMEFARAQINDADVVFIIIIVIP